MQSMMKLRKRAHEMAHLEISVARVSVSLAPSKFQASDYGETLSQPSGNWVVPHLVARVNSQESPPSALGRNYCSPLTYKLFTCSWLARAVTLADKTVTQRVIIPESDRLL
jgi:hypothetical protein